MKGKRTRVILGILLIIIGFSLMKTPAYTSVKGMVLDSGGNIGLAIAVAMGLIALAFASGITLLRKA
ncbi:MAG TPA: hypothetical protein VF181_09575 [Balneolaceae bacterium]